MDEQFLEREKELFKLNAKLNAKTKKIQVIALTKAPAKPVQIHTANNNFNYYEEPLCPLQKESKDDGLELLCKKISISNQPVKKPHEIVYPLFNRQTAKQMRKTNRLDVNMPAMILDGSADVQNDEDDVKSSINFKTETYESLSFKNESMVTRYSDDSSVVPSCDPVSKAFRSPPNLVEVIPKSNEKKNISNDGLLK